ncbi:hypothetical protein ACFLTV_02820, partial [Chloroflexota bacterium]
RMVQSLTYPLKEFPKVHFSKIPNIGFYHRIFFSPEAFNVVATGGKSILAIELKQTYTPLFVAMLIQNRVRYFGTKSSPSAHRYCTDV